MKALIVALGLNWASSGRLPRALHDAGFEVIGCGFRNGLMAKSRFARSGAYFEPPMTVHGVWTALRMIWQRWRPDFVIPGDDIGLRLLHAFALHDQSRHDDVDREIVGLIRRSLGDPAHYLAASRKSALASIGADPALQFPAQAACFDPADLAAVAARIGYPVAVKRDNSSGGKHVAIIRAPGDLEGAVATLAPLAADSTALPSPSPPAGFLVQGLVEGEHAATAFAAMDGRLLAAFAYRILQRTHALGPASVVAPLDRPDLIRQSATLVKRFGFTGLGGVDFIIDAASRGARIIEFNPRVTITAHLGDLFGCDLCAALHAALSGNPIPTPAPARHQVIALFPHELQRSPASYWLQAAHQDLPQDEPELMQALLDMTPSEQPLFRDF